MKERPILFSGPMVRALLDGRKTQTRRVMKRQPPSIIDEGYAPKVYWPARDTHMSTAPHQPAYVQFERPGEFDGRHIMKDGFGFYCPYGQPGDRLWVRETHLNWWKLDDANPEGPRVFSHVAAYAADGYELEPGEKWIPSIHMLRAASRITLEVTGVRVERLQDISEADAIAEGLDKTPAGFWSTYGRSGVDGTYSPVSSYHCLWESINGDGSWDANPWVWVVEFRRVEVKSGDSGNRPSTPVRQLS